MSKKKKVNIQLVDVDVVMFLSRDDYHKYLHKKGVYDVEMHSDGVCTSLAKGTKFKLVIGIEVGKHKPLEIKGLIVHELSHAITLLFKEYGFNDDELRSYLLQFLYIEFIGWVDGVLTP